MQVKQSPNITSANFSPSPFLANSKRYENLQYEFKPAISFNPFSSIRFNP